MSEDPIGRKATICPLTGKARYSRGEAKSIAKRQKGDINLQAYRCRSCRGWHVGNLRRGFTKHDAA